MKTSKIKLISVAAGLAMMGAAGSANAEAYALSSNMLLDGFIVSNNAANTFGAPVNTSADAATLTGFTGVSNSDVGLGLRNALVSTLGTPVRGQDVYVPFGRTTASSYSAGDSILTQEQSTPTVVPGKGIQAKNIAESNVAISGSATASGDVSSGTTFKVALTVAIPGTVSFSFSFDPLLKAFLDAGAQPGSKAEAILAASVTITNDLTGAVVYVNAPDGILQAGETSDPYSLNKTLSRFTPGDNTIDDPLGVFSATTGNLAVGNYNLVLAMKESTSVIRVAKVPEPTSLALMGLALAGLGFTKRRKQA